MSKSDRRRGRVVEVRRKVLERDGQDLEVIKQKLRRIAKTSPPHTNGRAFGANQPSAPLYGWEAHILLRALEVDRSSASVGTPPMLSGWHRVMATHYWWLRETGDKKAAAVKYAKLTVATMWDVSAKSVEKYAAEHKAQALEAVRNAKVDSAASDGCTDGPWIQGLEAAAETYRAFGK